jgi:hypothetical protein
LLLRYYNYILFCILKTDTSDKVVATILLQKYNDYWFSIAFFSKTIVTTELNYEVYNKEILAIVKSLGYWHVELTSTLYQIRIYIDHKTLEYFITIKALNI